MLIFHWFYKVFRLHSESLAAAKAETVIFVRFWAVSVAIGNAESGNVDLPLVL